MSLESLDPETAVEQFLTAKRNEYAPSTLQSHQYRLGHFVRWCEKEGLDDLNDLGGRDIHDYRVWRTEEATEQVDSLSPKSEKTQLDSLRVFLRWCESVDAVEPGLNDKVPTPKLSTEDETRHVMLEDEEAEAMLAYLRKYEYASVDHVVIELLWHTGMRLGAVRALDVDDYYPEEQYTVGHNE